MWLKFLILGGYVWWAIGNYSFLDRMFLDSWLLGQGWGHPIHCCHLAFNKVLCTHDGWPVTRAQPDSPADIVMERVPLVWVGRFWFKKSPALEQEVMSFDCHKVILCLMYSDICHGHRRVVWIYFQPFITALTHLS